MVTVPAQSFCAPTLAKFIAAARDMPVLVREGRGGEGRGGREGSKGYRVSGQCWRRGSRRG